MFLTESFAGWLSAKGVLEACSLLNVMPSVNIVKLSWSGQRLPLPLWVVKRCKTKQAVSEKGICYLMQYEEKHWCLHLSFAEQLQPNRARNCWSNDISKF